MRFKFRFLILLVLGCFTSLAFSQSQNLTIDRGAMGLAQALDRLPLTSRVMFIAAHPDDEPADVLTYVSRGLHAKTALLTLTRGEGGQNLISPDLFDALGLLRTGELLAADEYYGVQQYFTRAFDFGFSKNPEETLQKWGREPVLNDMVRAIRTFRPDVIVSVWQGNSKDGHGHHQAAGILAKEAFQLAADAQHFPNLVQEGLAPWHAQKLYIGNLKEKEPASFAINTGEFVPLLGASFQQIGSQGYSLHRTQGMGNSYAAPGNHLARYRLVLPVEQQDTGFLDHVNVSLAGLANLLRLDDPQRSWLENQLRTLEVFIKQAQDHFSPNNFFGMYDPLLKGLAKIREIHEKVSGSDHLCFLLVDKEQDFVKALELATGISFEALADNALVTPGQSFTVTASVTNRSSALLHLKQVELQAGKGWKAKLSEGSLKTLSQSEKAEFKFKVSVPSDARPSRPHWERNSKADALYTISQVELINSPLSPPVVRARLAYSILGSAPISAATTPSGGAQINDVIQNVSLTKESPLEYLDSDHIRGTHHVPVLVAPALALELTPPLHVISLDSSSDPRWVRVELTNHSQSPLQGNLVLKPPQGWNVEPTQQPFSIGQESEAASFRFKIMPTDRVRPGKASFEAIARVKGRDFDQGYRIVSVMDLWRNLLFRNATSDVITLDVKVPPKLSLGYIMGAGDRVPEILQQLGLNTRLLQARDLAEADLSQFSCIVAGIRAYEVRRDLIANNSRLLDYVRNGGVYIVQYNTPGAWNKSQYGPYPAKIKDASHRVTDETAPVKILDPRHPLFNVPNKITEKDFEGWVQERGLYFIQDRDPRFKPLLSTNDPGDPPLDGGLLIAEYGEGRYVLTSYAWFRQLPEGVPGAIRIFANLISLTGGRGHKN